MEKIFEFFCWFSVIFLVSTAFLCFIVLCGLLKKKWDERRQKARHMAALRLKTPLGFKSEFLRRGWPNTSKLKRAI